MRTIACMACAWPGSGHNSAGNTIAEAWSAHRAHSLTTHDLTLPAELPGDMADW